MAKNRVITGLALTALAAITLLGSRAAPAHAAGPVSVWLAPGGTGDGLTAASPAGTLAQAQADLEGPDAGYSSATVNMKAGGAFDLSAPGGFTWADPYVTFQPWGYTGGGYAQVAALGGYPVLDGGNADGVMLTLDDGVITLAGDTLGTAGTNAHDVTFRYVRFQHRGTGLVRIWGGSGDAFYGDVFTAAGNKYSGPAGCGYGALMPGAATGLIVSNSHFTDLENTYTNVYHGLGAGPARCTACISRGPAGAASRAAISLIYPAQR